MVTVLGSALEEKNVTVKVLTDQPDLDQAYEDVNIRTTPDGFLVITKPSGAPVSWFPPDVWLKVAFGV